MPHHVRLCISVVKLAKSTLLRKDIILSISVRCQILPDISKISCELFMAGFNLQVQSCAVILRPIHLKACSDDQTFLLNQESKRAWFVLALATKHNIMGDFNLSEITKD